GLPGPRRIDVQLPAQLADVRDALGENRNPRDADAARLHERKPVVGYVVVRDTLERLARMRAPHSDHRKLIRRFAQLHLGVAASRLHTQPSQVAVHVPGPSYKTEAIWRQARDGHV